MNANSFIRNPIAAALLGATLAAPVGAAVALGHAAPVASAASVTSSSATTPQAALPDFAGIVRQSGPAVVNITVKEGVKTSARGTPNPRGFQGFPGFGSGDDDPFSQFFRQLPHGAPRGPMLGQGSGFIVKSDGVILTNAHVVADAKEVTVKLTDRREFTAKVIGLDETSDVAVLKIAATGLPTVKLGDPSRAQIGEWVVAIGAPFGFENSVTQGIVSAKGRTLPDGSYVPFLQTDVAVNPGNSGGPLFNLAGEVIGINSQIYSRDGAYQGVSFAIPIDVAMNVSEQLQTTGHVARGKIGVTVQAVDGALAKSFGLPKPEGALVANVEKGSAADKAGLQPGDVILSFNGNPVQESSELPAQVAALPPGKTATLGIWRDKHAREISVKLGEMGGKQMAANGSGSAGSGRLGLAVRPLTQDEQRDAETAGLLVEDVNGAAEEAGIRPGDIVISANGEAVKSVEQLRSLTQQSHEHMALLIQRNGQRLFVPVDIG